MNSTFRAHWLRAGQAFLFSLLVLALAAPTANAQVLYGSIVGSVQDTSGGSVPGATVTLASRGSGLSRTATSDENGAFTFPNVLPGAYDVAVAADGFSAYKEENLDVTVNRVRRIDVRLTLSSVNESITVSASTLALQTEKTDVNAEIDSRSLTNMPLPNYRNYQSLLNLVPGTTPSLFQNSIGASPGRSLSTNVNGVNRQNNVTKVDGAPSVFIWLPHHTQYVAPSETIETVNISTNNFDAEQGMAGGAAITVQTKSGTNEFHGSAFAYHDNQRLRAKNFFSHGRKPRSTRNINGFTVGGPIVKNKLFYFGGFESYRDANGFERTNLTVATADQRAGDFSAYGVTIYDPNTGAPDGSGRTPFANAQVPLSRQSSITRKLQDLVPLPNVPGSGFGANYAISGTPTLNRANYDTKINWNKSETLAIWGKYSAMDATFTCEAALGQAQGPGLCDGGISGKTPTLEQVSTLGWTKTFSPSFLWDGTVGWTRHDNNTADFVGSGTNFGSEVLGIPGTNGSDPRQSGLPMFYIEGGYDVLGNPEASQPSYQADTTFSLEQNFSYVKSRHNLRFGFQGLRHHLNHWQPELGGGPRGRFDFYPDLTDINGPQASFSPFHSYAGFLLGLPSVAGKSTQWEKMTAFNYQFAFYVRDTWQVTPRLTMNLGLRWEKFPMQTRSGRGGIEWWDPETNLIHLGGVGDNPKDLGISTSNTMFAPRVGLAYKLTNFMVLRSGYGITNNPLPFARPLRGSFPLVIAQAFAPDFGFASYRPLEQGIPEIVGPAAGVSEIELPGNVINRSIAGKDLVRGYIQSWNFILESKLPGEFIGSVGYVGTATVNGFADLNINAAEPGTGAMGRPLARKFGRVVDTLAWNGRANANYHALQTTINRRAATGLTVKGAYTYSTAINMTDEDGIANLLWNIPSQYSRNRARAGYDQNHVFQLGFVYELPFGKGKAFANQGFARVLFGDWQVNGMASAFQGRRFSVSAPSGGLNAPGNSQTANQIKPEVERIGDIGPGSFYYDPTAFAQPARGTFGTTGRNILRGPGTTNLDLSLFRRFPIKERTMLEFRAEAFNATNTPHFVQPANGFGSATFMQVTAAVQDQRQFRFGLRLQW